MGYACPVCETPQSDGKHLANHFAFTAILGDDEHEAWLDEHAPGWDEESPDELASRITESVPEAEYPQVFEDTVHDHGHDQGHRLEDELQQTGGYGRDTGVSGGMGSGEIDADARAILEEAQRMTREMVDDEPEADESNSDEANAEDENE
ncbi:DUF5810 domain-containing protein [Haladaptatus sp. NG-WS-4]